MRIVYALCGALACSLPLAGLADDDWDASDELPPLASNGWWNNPQLREALELANPFSYPEIPREPRYLDPYGWQFLQDPYRIGFTKHDEIVLLPSADLRNGGTGSMQLTEFYSWLRYSYLCQPDLLVNLTGIFDGYYWSGPAQPQLPGQVDRLSIDMEAVLLSDGPRTTTIGFHPQIVTDFEHHLTNRAFSFDGKIFQTYKLSPEWLLVYGVAVWNRVDIFIIPEVGAIWMPDDRWELRLLFPRSQFSYRIGEVFGGGQTWLTSTVEYVVQAYQVDIEDASYKDRIQLQDWRASLGLRTDYERISWTMDVGVVFDRHVDFRGVTPGFDLAPTSMFRVGMWY